MPDYTLLEIEAALARANGQTLANIKNVTKAGDSLEDRGKSRDFGQNPDVHYKKKTAHTYAHVATFSQGSLSNVVKGMAVKQAADKSLWQDRRSCVAGSREVINSTEGKAVVAKFQSASPPTGPQRIGPGVPVTGDYYGYSGGSSELRKVATATTCIYICAGVLFITTSYPQSMVAGPAGLYPDPDLDLSALFG